MLGWEFPPHISGGLGTACYGLTQGLKGEKVDVTFVVPRAHGDEDRSYVDLVGCNQVQQGGGSHAAGANASDRVAVSSGTSGSASADEQADAARKSIELLAVDSLLSPYADEEEYAQRYADHVARFGQRAADTELAQGWQALWTRLASSSQLDEAPALVETGRRLENHVAAASTGGFSGRYGPDLMAEVARYAVAVARVADKCKFDVIHAHDWMTYPAGLVASALTKKPLVVHMHASEFDRSGEHVNARIHALEQLGLHGSDRVICVSRYTSRIMETRYGVPRKKLRVVHNAVLESERKKRTARKAIPEPIVLFLGRVTFQKGPDYFLEAARRVVEIEPNVKFVMAGSGDMLPKMIERTARLGLARHVHFTGFLRGASVKRMYSMADCYVMPSVSEPFGISPLEAMELDVPVIVSKQSGVSEILKNALKVDFWDVDALANKILAVIRYRGLSDALCDAGRSEVSKIRWDRPARLVRKVYEELVA